MKIDRFAQVTNKYSERQGTQESRVLWKTEEENPSIRKEKSTLKNTVEWSSKRSSEKQSFLNLAT
jgi:hypothetical protein